MSGAVNAAMTNWKKKLFPEKKSAKGRKEDIPLTKLEAREEQENK